MSAADEKSLNAFEMKILRKIFAPICVNDEYRLSMHHELYELYDDMELARRVKIQRLRWLVHVVRMDGQECFSKLMHPGGSCRRQRPSTHWRDQLEYDINSRSISNWRQSAGRSSDCRVLLNGTTGCSAMKSK